ADASDSLPCLSVFPARLTDTPIVVKACVPMLDDIIELHRAGRLPEAEAGYRELLAANPDDPEVLHLLGILRGQCGDTRKRSRWSNARLRATASAQCSSTRWARCSCMRAS